jgi:peptidoglycan-N-acetylglucosamine deacetylase
MSREMGPALSTRTPGPGQRTDQVFSDPLRRRRRWVTGLSAVVGAAAFAWFTVFVMTLYLVDKLPGSSLDTANAPEASAVSATAPPGAMRGGLSAAACVKSPYPPLADKAGAEGAVRLPTETVWAYLPFQPENSHASLATGARQIDVLLTDWYRLDAATGALVAHPRDNENQEQAARTIAREGGRMAVMPVVTVVGGALGAGGGAGRSEALAAQLAAAAAADGAAGMCLMPEGIDTDEFPAFARLLSRLDSALASDGRSSCLVTAPADGLLGDPQIAALADHVVLKLFREPWIGDPPRPLAPQGWFENTVATALDTVGRGRLVVMLGSFASDWSVTRAAPDTLSFAEALRRVEQNGGRLGFQRDVANLRLRYHDRDGGSHEVWALDAASLYNQLMALSGLDLRQVGLWALGFEDPSIWPLLAARSVTPDLAAHYISRVDLSAFVSYIGQGPFQTLARPTQTGLRFVEFDESGRRIVAEGFNPPAMPVTLRRFGAVAPDQVAITFDDGPDPAYTAAILDVLRDREAPAAFFVVGANALGSPDLVRRMIDEGHEIGSHTFLHPSLESVPPLRTRIELNALQRLLATITGHGTVLFRNPYGRGEGPITGASAAPIAVVTEGGYLMVGSDVVPPDWLGLDTAAIVDFVTDQLATEGGNVIVLHDGGGDRAATVAALGPLIDRLRADGYRIVGLADLLGVDRAALMPAAQGPATMLDKVSFGLIGLAGTWLVGLFWVVVLAGALRALAMLGLAHLRRPHPAYPAGTGAAPPVTVLIPAFNEETTILRCVESVFASDYPDLRVIVIDDGSTDHTYDKVIEVAERDPRLCVIHEPNGGKWKALDTAYRVLVTDIVVAIDADSMVARSAISQLVRHFEDPEIGAVAGRVQVGNRRGLLTRLQALEYLTAQNIDRRAFETLNAMPVVPGAIGAWRTDAVIAAGLYSSQTVTEDADLTVSVIRAGYRVVYEPAALAVTEAPERVGAFLTQRLRWSFGMLQTAVKHLVGAMRQRKAIGFVALPDLLLVGFGLAVLAPLADLVLVTTLIDLAVDAALGRPAPASDIRPMIALGYLVLPLLDIVTLLAAMRFDRSEPLWLVLLFPFQRLYYRQLLYITAWRAMLRALFGRLTGWGKLARTGSARLPAGEEQPSP